MNISPNTNSVTELRNRKKISSKANSSNYSEHN